MKLKLKNVTKSIHGNVVIDHVSLTLNSGHVYGLCGYNGCGKTMLMRLIAGLIRPSSGSIFFDEKQLGKEMDFPPNTGLLIENPSFLGGYSGFENLKLLASIHHKADADQICKALQRVGLEYAKDKKYRKYSLGMKQRLGIAAAIMESPDLIILDEPTNALDADGIVQVKQIIQDEKKRGALVLMTCHDREILEDMCDVIYRIELGRIVSEMR